MHSHWQRNKEIADRSRHVLAHVATPQTRDEVTAKMQALKTRWTELRAECERLANYLHEAEQAASYFQEANEAESWIKGLQCFC